MCLLNRQSVIFEFLFLNIGQLDRTRKSHPVLHQTEKKDKKSFFRYPLVFRITLDKNRKTGENARNE